MFGLVLLLLIVVPIVELYVLTQVADSLGWINSIGLLLLISVVGAVLMKWQTAGAVGRVFKRLRGGELPSAELVDGGLMIFGGALLLTPGFFTDVVGIAMFLPPTRAIARAAVLKRVNTRVGEFKTNAAGRAGASFGGSFPGGFPNSSGFPNSGFPNGTQSHRPNRQARTGDWIDVNEVEHVDLTRNDNPDTRPPLNPPGASTS